MEAVSAARPEAGDLLETCVGKLFQTQPPAPRANWSYLAAMAELRHQRGQLPSLPTAACHTDLRGELANTCAALQGLCRTGRAALAEVAAAGKGLVRRQPAVAKADSNAKAG